MIDGLRALRELMRCGVDEGTALFVIEEYIKEHDEDGLAEYIREARHVAGI